MDNEEEEVPAIERLDHKVIATMHLSGTTFHVGQYFHPQGDSLFIKTDEQYEPIYISTTEAKLLIAALKACYKGDN